MSRYIHHFRFWLRIDPARPNRWQARRRRPLAARRRSRARRTRRPASPETGSPHPDRILEDVAALLVTLSVAHCLVKPRLHEGGLAHFPFRSHQSHHDLIEDAPREQVLERSATHRAARGWFECPPFCER